MVVSETLAGISRQSALKGELPAKKAATVAAILHRILSRISDDLRGLRDRTRLLTGFARALRHSELAPIPAERLEKTLLRLRCTLHLAKGSQTCPPALWSNRALSGAGNRRLARCRQIDRGPVFRRIWLPKKAQAPLHCPQLARVQLRPGRSPPSLRREPLQPASLQRILSGTASSVARLPPARIGASIPPSSNAAAGTSRLTC